MAQNITLLGASYSAVPAVMLPKTGGGQARFDDVTDTTLQPEQAPAGTFFHRADGQLVEGTADGVLDLPVFTGVWSSDWSTLTITCNKTFAECYDDASNARNGAFFEFSLDDPVEPWNSENTATATYIDNTKIVYTSFGNTGPNEDVVYHSDGTIEYVQPSSMQIDLEVTQNGYYYPQHGVYTSVNVNVPAGTSKATYTYLGLASRMANSYGATNAKVRVTKAGTYNISYVAVRGSSSGTMGTNLHIGSTSGTNNTTWNSYGQYVHLTNQSISANTDVTIYATSGSNSRSIYVGQLIVEEAE